MLPLYVEKELRNYVECGVLSLALDGVYVQGDDDTPTFLPTPELADDDVRQIVETTARRVIRLLDRRGVLDDGELDRFADESPVLAGMTAASVQGLISALVPPPRVNQVRYHGILAPHAKDRDKIVPAAKETGETSDKEDAAPRKYRLSWSALRTTSQNRTLNIIPTRKCMKYRCFLTQLKRVDPPPNQVDHRTRSRYRPIIK